MRWCRRNPLAAAIVSVLMMGLVASVAGWRRAAVKATVFAENAQTAQRRAEEAWTDKAGAVLQAEVANNSTILADPQVMNQIANSLSDLGDVCWQTARTEEAVQRYEQSLEVRASLLKSDADSDHTISAAFVADNLSKMLHTHGRIGYLCLSRLHDYVRAEWHFREQLLVAGKQLEQQPDDPIWQKQYVLMLLDLSSALQRQCEFKAAESAARDALSWLEQAAQTDPDNALTQRDFASGLDHLGLAQLGQGQFVEAERSLASAYEWYAKASTRAESIAVVADNQPRICYKLVIVSERLGNYPAAITWIDCLLEHLHKQVGSAAEEPALSASMKHLLAMRQALELAPRALDDRNFVYDHSDEIVCLLAPIRIVTMARRGETDAARREAREFAARWPQLTAGTLSLAFVDSIAATNASDQAEKAQMLESATAAMIKVLVKDRSLLDTLHLFPDLVPLLTFTPFREQLEDLVRARE